MHVGSMEFLRAIWHGLRLEFSDLPDVAQTTSLVVRFLLSALLGGLIGLERERSGKAAGLRTHMLVCVGTTLFVAAPQLGGFSVDGLSRVIQGVCTGVGFLGAGAILKHQAEHQIEGLTTAASVWLTAAVGVTVGMGRDASAALGTALALGVLWGLPRLLKAREETNRD